VVRNGLILDPAVRSAASKVSASADEVRVQRAAIFPSLGLSLGAGVGKAGQDDTSIDLTGRQLILDFGDTKRAVTAADLDLQIDYISFQQAVDTAAFDVLEAYDSVRMYVLLLEVREKQFAAMRDLQTLVAERTDIGAASSSDILETRKRVQAAEFLVHDTQLLLAEARDRLARLSGQSRGGKIPALKIGTCSAAVESDELRIARLELAKAELNLVRANKARLPRAYIGPVVRHQTDENGLSVGLDVSVNSDLLQGGALSARANAARNNRNSADAGISAARRNVDLDVGKLKREIAAAGRKTEMLKRQIALLVQTRSLYRSQYFDLGTREISELLDNEEEFYNRKAELIELESELTANQIECATRDRSLRKAMKIDGNSLYGYPLAPGDI
jgi:adhesin transport system outer membrane protein